MLIDRFAPVYDFDERHALLVRAGTVRAHESVSGVDLARSHVIRLLFRLRGLPGRGPLTIRDLTRLGFVILDEDSGAEIVLGLIGRFWRLSGGLRRVEGGDFATFSEPGYVKAVWNFRVEPAGPERSMVSTETRVIATDPAALRSFRRYWMLIRPFSGLIRRRALALIREEAESAARGDAR
ncbi:MAG TPA: hypothetical protein VJQ57_14655 [Acidimicrobiia bacterium]|nr:hypothetical protein [Acidimicrobiia bacterium]